MTAIFSKALKLLTSLDLLSLLLRISKKRPLKNLTERELIQLESEIGAKLFGAVPKNGRREFFNLDKRNWIWYEERQDTKGKVHAMTIRYEVHDDGVLKIQPGSKYTFINSEELKNLTLATQLYHENVMRHVYKRDPSTGKNSLSWYNKTISE